MNKVKILFLIPTLHGGGSERVLTTIANGIDPSVFEPIFAVLDARNAFFQLDESRVRLVNLNEPRVSRAFLKIRRLILFEKPHVVVSTLSHLNLIVAIFRWALPKNVHFVARESSVVSINNQQQRFPKLYNFLMRRFYPRFDRIICQSEDMRDDFLENFGLPFDKISVINNPVNVAAIAEKLLDFPKNFNRTPLSKLPRKIRFVTVGRLDKGKGIDRLLTILSRLDFDFQFDIIGDGSELGNLKNLAKSLKINEKVEFLGAQKNPFPFIAAADIFLFGSRYEGFPNVLIEAGACGVPIVAFNCKGGISEILRDGDNGFAVPDGDFTAFENAIRRAITTDFDHQKIKKLTAERFGEAEILKKYEAVFLELTPQYISEKNNANT